MIPGRIKPLLAAVVLFGVVSTSVFAQPGGDDRGDRRGSGGPGGGFGGPGGGFGGPGGGFGRGGGGRGGRGGDAASLGTQIRSDDVLKELGLSEEQGEQIRDDLPESSELREMYGRMFRTQDPDEQQQIRNGIREAQQKLEAETEAALRKALTPEQMTKLFGIVYREAGARALARSEVADQLKLSNEQQDNLRRLLDERTAASFQLGWNASEEDRKKFDEEWNEKLTAVLTPEQKQQWQTLASSAGTAGPAAPANTVSAVVAAGTGAARPVLAQTPGSITRNGDGTRSDDVVASFEPPRAADADVTSDEQYDPAQISFNFQNAPWADVLDMFAKRANLTLDPLDIPPGTFTYKDTRAYPPRKALDILHGYLLQRGHVMVQRDRFLVVLNIDNRPIPPNSVEKISLIELQRRFGEGIENEIVQVIFPLDSGLDAEQVATQIEGLLGPQRQVVALKSANALAVRDSVANLTNLGSILERMAAPLNPEDVVFKAFPLKHILASEAEPHIRSLFGLTSATPNVSSAARDQRNRFNFGGFGGGGGWPGWGGRGRGDDDDDRNQRNQAALAATTAKPVQVTSDRRTNMLLIAATPSQLAAVEEVIKSIDVPVDRDTLEMVGNNTPVFRVYQLTTAEPDEVAQTLTALMPNVVINDDDQRGRGFVHILATPLEHQKVEEYIRQMDGKSSAATITTIPLNRQYHPTSVAAMLSQLFVGEAENAPTILGESATWRLLVKGSPEQIIAVRKAVTDMGLEGDASVLAGGGGGTGRFRPIEMNGRDAAKVARRLRDILEGSGSLGNRINVIIPAEGQREGRSEEPAGTPRIRMETPSEPGDYRPLDTQRTNFERTQTSTRRGSPDPADPTTEGFRDADSRSAQSPPQESRPLEGIQPQTWGPVTSFDVPQPRGAVEVDLVPGTGILMLKGNRSDLDTLQPVSESERAQPAPQSPDKKRETTRLPRTASMQFVSFQPGGETSEASESSDTQAAGQSQSASNNGDLGPVLDELGELLNLEDLAEQQRSEAEPQPEDADGAAEQAASQPAPADEAQPAAPNRGAAAQPNGSRENTSRAEVTIEVQGGKLYIYSADEAALDQVEAAVTDILSQMPAENIWTVFYLRSADVLEAADMLSQLMPDTTVATMSSASGGGLLNSLSGGLSGMASGLMSMTGLDTLGQGPTTLRIIPDLRSNSLWVSGPVDKVRDVETFLSRLDADELPESFRDRVPRTIDVYHANVLDVADMVRELYKDYLEDPNQNRNRGNNPLAMFMGGGGSNSASGNRPSGIRLTLSVDERTNQLIVSCSNSLFEQIKRTVESRDLAAMEARRTVRFVNVDAGSSSVIQETLSRALPNVRVSTTGTPADRRTAQLQQRANNNNNNDNQPGGGQFGGGDRGGGDDRERAERIRQFMESRQRQQQSGDSGNRGGGNPFGGGDRGGRGGFGGGGFGGGGFGGGGNPFGGGGFPGGGGRGFGGGGGRGGRD